MSDRLGSVYIHHCPLLAEFRTVQLCVEQHWANRKKICCAIHSDLKTSPESAMLTGVLCSLSHNVKMKDFFYFLIRFQVYESELISFFLAS